MIYFILGFLTVLCIIESIIIYFSFKFLKQTPFSFESINKEMKGAVVDKVSANDFYRGRNFDIRK